MRTLALKKNFLLLTVGIVIAIIAAVIIIRLSFAKATLNLAEKMGPRVRASEILVKTASFLGTSDAKLSFYVGLWYHKNHELVKAEKFYRQAVTLDPKIANTHYQLARVYFIQGRFQPALAEVNNELMVNPANYRSYYIRGLILGFIGKNKEAEADFKTFIKSPFSKETNGWGGYNDLAWVLLRQSKNEEALKILKEAEKQFPNNVWIENGLGGTYLALKNYKKSKEYYESALEGARKLTIEDWLIAYPAHDPKAAEEGVKQVIKGIERNLSRL